MPRHLRFGSPAELRDLAATRNSPAETVSCRRHLGPESKACPHSVRGWIKAIRDQRNAPVEFLLFQKERSIRLDRSRMLAFNWRRTAIGDVAEVWGAKVNLQGRSD